MNKLKPTAMNAAIKQTVDTNSTEFEEGFEAVLNSAEDTKNWKAGYALGQALEEEGETKAPIRENPLDESSKPVLLSHDRSGQMGNDQDEKDASAE